MVMRLFLKMLNREIRNNKGQFGSILIVIAIGIAFYTGFNSTLANLSLASEQYFREYRLAHLWAYFSKTPESTVARINRIPGVITTTGRMVQEVKLNPVETNTIIRLITLPDSHKAVVNDVLLKSGRYFTPNHNNQCLVEEAYFKAKQLRLGDCLRVVINGNETKLKIVGTVKSPEYIYQLRDSNELFPNPQKFGIAYIKESYGKTLFGFDGCINEATVLLSEIADLPLIQDKLERLLENRGLQEIIPRKEQISYDTFSSEIKQLKAVGSFFPLLFLGVAALITYITISRIVENQRTLIGTLKALGYANTQILAYYLSFAVIIGIAGSVLGTVLGHYFNQFMINLYNTMYQLPLENMRPQYNLIIPASLLTLGFGILAGFNAAKGELRLAPVESMRPKAPKAGQTTLLEQLKLLWQRCNFSWKMILRNLSRYKRRVLMASCGIALATSLLLTAFGMNDSLNYLIDQQFSCMQRYDLKVTLNLFVNLDELNYLRHLPHITQMEPIAAMGIELRNGWRVKKMGLMVMPIDSQLYRITTLTGRQILPPQSGILIPEKIGQLLQLNAGNRAKLKVLWPGKLSAADQKEVTVKGKVAQYVGVSAYGGMNQVNRFFEEGRIANVVLLKLDNPGHELEVVKKLRQINTISSVQSKAESVLNLQKAMESMNSMAVIFILAAGAMAIAVIYNITNINIHERYREMATLKVLGFRESEMKQLVFNENFIMTLLGLLGGLPLGRGLLEILMQSTTTDNMTVPAVLFGPSYLGTFCLMIAFTLLANRILTRKIRVINMVEALKSSE